MAEAFKTIEIPNYGPVNFPVTMSDDQVNSAIAKIIQPQPRMELKASQPAVDQEVESLAMKQGRQADLSMPSKMALSAAQGLTFNFAPKIAGAGAAGLDIYPALVCPHVAARPTRQLHCRIDLAGRRPLHCDGVCLEPPHRG